MNIKRKWILGKICLLILIAITVHSCAEKGNTIPLQKASSIVLIGNNLGSRMMNFGHFETEMHLRYPDFLPV